MHPSPGPSRIALLVAAAALLAVSCGAPGASAGPSPTAATSTSARSAAPFPSGPPVTVPGLTEQTAVSTQPAAAEPTTSPAETPAVQSPAIETTTQPTPEPPPPPPAPAATPEPSTPPAPEPSSQARTTPPATEPASAPTTQRPRGQGPVVVVDAGHNGANGANPSIINTQVDAGFGQTKPCNTTGTSTNDGYTESTFNYGVAQYLVPMLEAEGVTVVTTRDSNDGVGPCVDERAAIGNDARADAVVSIHGDGDESSAEGFYVMTAEQNPAGAAVAAESRELAVAVRDGLVGAGLSPHNRLGSDGLWRRGDLAGLNLSERPTVMIEAGNMRNPADAALMTSADGQRQVARGLADGILAYLAAG